MSVTDRVYRGHDGVRAGMVDVRRAWKSATLTSDEVIEVDAADHRRHRPCDRLDHAGARHYDAPLVWMAAFSNGRLQRVTSYSARAEALAAAAEARQGAD